MLKAAQIAAVVTMGFRLRSPAPLLAALEELLRLEIGLVLIIWDRKDPFAPGILQDQHILDVASKYNRMSRRLIFEQCDEYGTAQRWRRGILRAFLIEGVEVVLNFAGDMVSNPGDHQRTAWKHMVQTADRNSLILGDFDCRELFKRHFKEFALPIIEIMLPEQAKDFAAIDLRQPRTEFFACGRSIFECLDNDGSRVWSHDPTILLTSVAIHNGFDVRKVDLGHYQDDAGTRAPLGQLEQILRFAFQMAVAECVRANMTHRDVDEQLAAYDELSVRFDRIVARVRSAITANRRAMITNGKLANDGSWAKFQGFSYLFDNPDPLKNLTTVPNHSYLRQVMCNDVPFYAALSDSLERALRHTDRFERSFFPLPFNSYHVTAWDGICLADLADLIQPYRDKFATYLDRLPASLGDTPPWEHFPSFEMSGASITFKVDRLAVFEQAGALVALLSPADAASESLLDVIASQREAHYRTWERIGRKNPTKLFRFQPHVSLGYFSNSAEARSAAFYLQEWSKQLQLDGLTITFGSISRHAFTTMAHFFTWPQH